MAVVTGTLTAHDAIGNREDLADMIWNVDPTDTPLIQLLPRTDAESVLHEWQTDGYAAAASNAAIEGNEATFTTPALTTRLNNRCQIFSKTLVVSRTQEVVRKAGRRSESDYQLGKRVTELKRDMEFVIAGNQADAAGSVTVARALRSLEAWYATNDQRGASGADGSPGNAATDGTQRAFTETLLKAAVKAAWDSGGTPSDLILGSFNKQVLSGFAGNASRMTDASSKKLVAAIDLYESDFGVIRAWPDRFSRARTVHVIDPNMVALAELDGFKVEPLAKTGDARKWLATFEGTLEVRNEKALAVVADLTTS